MVFPCQLVRALFLLGVASLAAPGLLAQPVTTDTLYAQAAYAPSPEIATPPSAEDEMNELRHRVDVLQAQLEELEQTQREAAPRVALSGQLFGHYGVEASGTGAVRQGNSFAVNRLYITAKGRLSDHFGFRATTDIVDAGSETGLGSVLILKYAYLDWKAQPWLKLRAGVLQTGWNNYVTQRWGYRGVAKVMGHQQKHIGMADVGLAATGTLPNGYGSVSVGVLNGSGYRALETDQFKDVIAYGHVAPFRQGPAFLQPLELGAHAYAGRFDSGAQRQRWGALAHYGAGPVRLGVNYESRRDGLLDDGGLDVGTRNGHGVSVFGEFALDALGAPAGLAVLGLVDFYDPDRAVAEDAHRRSVIGLAYSPNRTLTVALDHQQVTTTGPSFDRHDGSVSDTDARVFLHLVVNY